MKKSICAIICIFTAVLTACALGKVKIPSGSADYLNRNYADVVSELEEAGFKDIQSTAIDDLTSENKDKDGMIESISIGEVTEFEAEQKFNADDPIMIEYHNLPKLSLPAEINDIQAMTYKEIADAFMKAGFINVITEEVYDLDPDTESADHVNEVLINENSDFSADDSFPFDANVSIRGHYKYTKYTAKINIEFLSNLIFSKYDVSMLIDGEKQKDLSHGEDGEIELRLKEGEHKISFQKIDDAEVNGEAQIDVSSDLEASFSISCHDDYIEVENNYIDYDVVLEEGQIKIINGEDSYYGEQYKDVEAELSGMGFTNITTVPNYDIVFDITAPGTVKSVTIDGRDDYRRGNIFQNNAEIIITYSMKDDDDPEYIAEQKRKEEERKKQEELKAQMEKKEEEEKKKKAEQKEIKEETETAESVKPKADKKDFQTVTYGSYNGNALTWFVLKKEDDKSLLITEQGIGEMPFKEATIAEEAYWDESTLRTWLNENFYNAAFSDGQKEGILTTEVEDYERVTSDKVFLLSSNQVDEYFPTEESRRIYMGYEWWLLDNYTTSYDKETINCDTGEHDWLRGNESCVVRPVIWVLNEKLN